MKAKNIIMNSAKKAIATVSSGVSKHSPTILIIAGGVGVIAGVVLAIKAGKDADAKTKKAREDLETVHSMKEKVSEEPQKEEVADGEFVEYVYTKMDYAKDLTHAYGNLIIAYGKAFGPAVLTTMFSLFLIFTSHRIMTKRYAMTYASLGAMTKAYDAYRKNVIEAEGFEADQRYRFGIKAIEEEKPLLDKEGNPKLDKEGNPKKIKTKYDVMSYDIMDPRSVLWDEMTAAGRYDNKSTDELIRYRNNLNIIYSALRTANNKLEVRAKDPRFGGIGFIYLNEVLEMLGMKPIDIGQMVGWRYDPRLDIESDDYDPYFKKPDDWGDNRVDFGLDNPDIPGYELRQRFLSGDEEGILLYMNWDGLIYDKIGCRSIFTRR